jgi:hypothetical protein
MLPVIPAKKILSGLMGRGRLQKECTRDETLLCAHLRQKHINLPSE